MTEEGKEGKRAEKKECPVKPPSNAIQPNPSQSLKSRLCQQATEFERGRKQTPPASQPHPIWYWYLPNFSPRPSMYAISNPRPQPQIADEVNKQTDQIAIEKATHAENVKGNAVVTS